MIFFSSRIPRLVSWFFPVAAITIGPLIFCREAQPSETLLNHERIHVKQGKELWFVGFWFLYLLFFFWHLRRESAYMAYMKIPFEREARAKEWDLSYLRVRERHAWKNYL